MPEEKISVLLVDDHSLVRRGFRRMLEDEADINVVGEAADGEEAINLVRSLAPRVMVMDCALPGMNGMQAREVTYSRTRWTWNWALPFVAS